MKLSGFGLAHRSEKKVKGAAFMGSGCIKGVIKFWPWW